jgi:NAD(P)H-hydrate epimerase
MRVFDKSELKKLFKPAFDSSGEDNGQITIIGGSKLFHGAPVLALKVASRIVDMVFFATPEPSVGEVAEKIKSKILSFIWVPWEDTEDYIKKSDAVLIGPGFMRFGSEKTPEGQRNHENHIEGQVTRQITQDLLEKFPNKRWVIDAGSLQVMEASWIPAGAIVTPNKKEFEMLFKNDIKNLNTIYYLSDEERGKIVGDMARKYGCIIVLKGPSTIVCSPNECVLVKGGNPGMTKGGTGDVLAGLTVALLAKNDPFLAACAASYIAKFAADMLYKKVGVNYNADDLADFTSNVFGKILG